MDEIDRLWDTIKRSNGNPDNAWATIMANQAMVTFQRYLFLVIAGFSPKQAFEVLSQSLWREGDHGDMCRLG